MARRKQAREALGSRIARLRIERGLSQRKLGELSGISYAYVSRIEGNDRYPSIAILRQLAETLDVTPHYLETGDDTGLWIYVTKPDLAEGAGAGCPICSTHAAEAGISVPA